QHMVVAAFVLSRESEAGHTIFEGRWIQSFHFLAATVVPLPSVEWISNSSISRRTPGRPSPRLPDVEKPSRMHWEISSMPGPSSAATTCRLLRDEEFNPRKVITPLPA